MEHDKGKTGFLTTRGRHIHRIKLHPSDRPLKLLTFNVFMRPIVGDYSDLKDERLEHIKEAIMKYDIVCFQELFSTFNNRRDKLIEFAQECKFGHVGLPPCPGMYQSVFQKTMINSGLLTISKCPIVTTEFTEYKAKSGVDGLANKGVLYTKILLPNQTQLHLFNTHLQATYNNTYQTENLSDHNNYQARLQQIQELRSIVSSTIEKHGNLTYQEGIKKFKDLVILAGDLNVNSRGVPIPASKFDKLEWIKTQQLNEFMEYEYLLANLTGGGKDKVVDLAFESYGYHPITFGDTVEGDEDDPSKKPKDKHLTCKLENMSEQSLDYIFQIIPGGTNVAMCGAEVPEKSCRVEEFFADEQHFTQLSDHYGIECSIRLK